MSDDSNKSLTDSSGLHGEIVGEENSKRGVLKISMGPFPSPEVLAKYEQIHPGAADRIFTFSETTQKDYHSREVLDKENHHTREMAKIGIGVTHVKTDAKHVHWTGFANIAPFILSGVCAYLDRPWIAGGSLGIFFMLALLKFFREEKGNKEKANGNGTE